MIITVVVGVLMIGNGMGHILGSAYMGQLLPGFWSSPFLILAAILVVANGLRTLSDRKSA